MAFVASAQGSPSYLRVQTIADLPYATLFSHTRAFTFYEKPHKHSLVLGKVVDEQQVFRERTSSLRTPRLRGVRTLVRAHTAGR